LLYLNLIEVLAGLLLTLCPLNHPPEEYLPAEPKLVQLEITQEFGESINIKAIFEPIQYLDRIEIFIKPHSNGEKITETLYPSLNGEIAYIVDLPNPSISLFSEVLIWFEVKMVDGTISRTEPTVYYYFDNRFNWKSLNTEEFTIFWYQDDPELGEKLLAIAYEGLAKINSLVDVPNPQGIKIYVYDDPADLQETLVYAGEIVSKIAGHAKPSTDTILVSSKSDTKSLLETRRQIPHEMVHILLFQKLGSSYINLPPWLNEGLATLAELTPNPDYLTLLSKAHEKSNIIPIEDLSETLPNDEVNFQLAYAESSAFTEYLYNIYGREVMEGFIQTCAHDGNCEIAVQRSFNKSLNELEGDWRSFEFSETPLTKIKDNALALIILLCIAFIVPIGLVIKNLR